MFANLPCPCHSGTKYKKCCGRFHQGMAAPDAVHLMRARYCAYALGQVDFVMATTHAMCGEYQTDRRAWAASIAAFSRGTHFRNLTILEFVDGPQRATVTFCAELTQGATDATFTEKSAFLRESDRWLYRDGQRLR